MDRRMGCREPGHFGPRRACGTCTTWALTDASPTAGAVSRGRSPRWRKAPWPLAPLSSSSVEGRHTALISGPCSLSTSACGLSKALGVGGGSVAAGGRGRGRRLGCSHRALCGTAAAPVWAGRAMSATGVVAVGRVHELWQSQDGPVKRLRAPAIRRVRPHGTATTCLPHSLRPGPCQGVPASSQTRGAAPRRRRRPPPACLPPALR